MRRKNLRFRLKRRTTVYQKVLTDNNIINKNLWINFKLKYLISLFKNVTLKNINKAPFIYYSSH